MSMLYPFKHLTKIIFLCLLYIMAINTLSSACNISSKLSHTLGYTPTCPDFRDASFSSYISNAKAISTIELMKAMQDQSTNIANFEEYQMSSQRNLADQEICIFGAEKYFNGRMDEDSVTVNEKDGEKPHAVNDHQVDQDSKKSKLTSGIMGSGSSSSWNSQSPLVPGCVKYLSPSRRKKGMRKRFFSTFNWRCPCFDRKSVDIDENVNKEKASKGRGKIADDGKNFTEASSQEMRKSISCQNSDKDSSALQKDENFAFPVSYSAAANLANEKQCEKEFEEENERKSLEVFGSPVLHKEDRALSFHNYGLTMFTWDINPTVENITATFNSSETQDDEESDSSSDLFEIKNLNKNAHPFFKRRVSDDMSSAAASTCYEPSESSIDWSDVTVTAVNSPIMSDLEEKTKTVIHEMQRSHPEDVMGCKTRRLVMVAGEAHRELEKAKSNKQKHHRRNTLTEITPINGNESSDLRSGSAQHSFRICSVPRWYSTRESQCMSTH